MATQTLERRDFLKSLLVSLSAASLDWSAFPVGTGAQTSENQFDAIIIGAGLGGLSCAAAFARQGFKPLVLEQHSKAGGYATTFKRKDFVFDASLHSTRCFSNKWKNQKIASIDWFDKQKKRLTRYEIK